MSSFIEKISLLGLIIKAHLDRAHDKPQISCNNNILKSQITTDSTTKEK